MFQLDFGRNPGPPDSQHTVQGSHLHRGDIDRVALLRWEEHCLECAQPECYRSCPLYVWRPDTNCARFTHGIWPSRLYDGLFDYGAAISFRKWGKLQTNFDGASMSVDWARRLAKLDELLVRVTRPFALESSRLRGIRQMKAQYYYHFIRKHLLRRIGRLNAERGQFDDFVVEAWSDEVQPFRLILEVFERGALCHRESLDMQAGHNFQRLPVNGLGLSGGLRSGTRVVVYPENDREVRVVFTWLDFVRYNVDKRPVLSSNSSQRANVSKGGPAPKVKCVVWDLDNTVWDGILVEDGPDCLSLRSGIKETIVELDRRGVLQSVASKNDYAPAWLVVVREQLDQFFLCPSINWGPKSASLLKISADLNIGIDSFAFIDDSAFERAEVVEQWPQVRVLDVTEVESMLDRPEFDLPVTVESRQRREMYQAETRRKDAGTAYDGDYNSFLRGCQVRASVFCPESEAELTRCTELLQRTNQLNISCKRYSRQQLDELIDRDDCECIAVSCTDRFGSYGLVGFISLAFAQPYPTIVDMAFSCRVAMKKLEHAVLGYLQRSLSNRGFERLNLLYLASDRNKPLHDVLVNEIGFAPVGNDGDRMRFCIDTSREIADCDIVALDEKRLAMSDS